MFLVLVKIREPGKNIRDDNWSYVGLRLQRPSSDVVEETVIGAFAPSGPLTMPDMSNANI